MIFNKVTKLLLVLVRNRKTFLHRNITYYYNKGSNDGLRPAGQVSVTYQNNINIVSLTLWPCAVTSLNNQAVYKRLTLMQL